MSTTQLAPDSARDYKSLVDAQAILSECTNRMAKLEAALQDDYITAIDSRRREFTTLQTGIAKAEMAIKDIATMHPEWFTDVKTVTTPYGSVQSRSGTKLEVANEEVTIALLQQLGRESEPFLRVAVTLNMEALESLPDEELARIRVKRITSESLVIKCAKPNLGKAAKAAEKKAKDAAAKQSAAN